MKMSLEEMMMNNGKQIDLSYLDDGFEDHPTESTKPVEIPDGQYKVKVIYTDIKESPKKNTPQLMWILEIMDGKFEGQMLYKYNTLSNTDKTKKQLCSDLEKCHVRLKKFVDLADKISELHGIKLIVQVKNNEYGPNVFFK